MPKLIYVKRLEGGREERLDDLIRRIQSDDTASYKAYETPDELAELAEHRVRALSKFVSHTAFLEHAAVDEASRTRLAAARERGREYSTREVADLALRGASLRAGAASSP